MQLWTWYALCLFEKRNKDIGPKILKMVIFGVEQCQNTLLRKLDFLRKLEFLRKLTVHIYDYYTFYANEIFAQIKTYANSIFDANSTI
jgi:hypothetical protein